MNRQDKKTILVVTTTFPRWENDHTHCFLADLYKRLTKSFNIIVVSPHYPKAKQIEDWSGIKVVRFKYFWPQQWQKLCYDGGMPANIKKNKLLILVMPFLLICHFLKVVALIKREKVDLLHAQWFLTAGLVASVAAKIYKKPLVVTAHGSDVLALKGLIWDKVRRFIISNATQVTAVSSVIAEELSANSALRQSSIKLTPMGVDTSLFARQNIKESGIDKKERILLFIGRLDRQKGLEYLIQAMPAILTKYPASRLNIIGYGPHENYMRQLVSKMGLNKKIVFIGSLPNKKLPVYYSQAEIFILPSMSEGLPVSILEAMACQCPVIATSVGGIFSLIQNEDNGLLIEPRSSDEICQAVFNLYANQELKEKIIKNAYNLVRHKYDWSILASQLADIYQRQLYDIKKN